jgi:hypothetical protein
VRWVSKGRQGCDERVNGRLGDERPAADLDAMNAAGVDQLVKQGEADAA